MATTTIPEVTKKVAPVTLTANAVAKVKDIMGQQNPVPAGLRIGVVGGGCSGFSYSMQFENGAGMMDKTFDMDGLKVFVDATSVMYLNGCIVDYVETLEGARLQVRKPEREEATCRLRQFLQRVKLLCGDSRLACPERSRRGCPAARARLLAESSAKFKNETASCR